MEVIDRRPCLPTVGRIRADLSGRDGKIRLLGAGEFGPHSGHRDDQWTTVFQ
jgi:hypothetical protein